jgi:hypothetical protein
MLHVCPSVRVRIPQAKQNKLQALDLYQQQEDGMLRISEPMGMHH